MHKEHENLLKTYGKKILGILLILVGIIGLFLPFLQGVLMISAGIILLGNKKLLTKMHKFWHYIKTLFTRKK
ncbi:MAG: PGPGW domain-containing protein [bacterium]